MEKPKPRFFVLTGGDTHEEAIDWVESRGHRSRRIHLTAASSVRCYGIAEIAPPRRSWWGAVRLAAPVIFHWLLLATLFLLAIGTVSLSAGRP